MGLLDRASELSEPRLQDREAPENPPRDEGDNKKKTDTWLGPTDIGLFEKGPGEGVDTSAGRVAQAGQTGTRIPDIHSLLWNAERIENDLQAPAEVFALIVREFQAKKAALLVLGYEREYFVPYSIRGFDETTEHRLRIPHSLLTDSSYLSEGYSLLGDDEKERFKRFFSNREYSLITKILLVPFRYDDDIIAVLMITDCPLLSASTLGMIDFRTLSRDLGEFIHNSRNTTLDRLTGAEVRTRSEVLSAVQEAIELVSGSENRLTFFLISLSSFLELLQREAENVETYRLREDAIRIISSMMPDSVDVFSVDQHVLLIVMPAKFHVNTGLLVHQIKVGLQTLFKIPQSSIDLSENSFLFPIDVTSSQEIIERIFSYSGTE